MSTNSLQQHVNEPTRRINIFDLVMTTTDLSINGLEVTDKISAHQMIDFMLEVQERKTRTQQKQVLYYKRANFELKKEELGSHNYEKILSDGVFTVEEVEEQLSILNPYKSTEPDGLGPRILKETAKVISEPLTNIFNRSLETGIVPEDWKRANVTPIFEKGNKQIPTNYHPFSPTSVISKTIERLLKVRITKHLDDQNFITDIQHRFRKKCSCLTNLLDFFGEVNRLSDRTKAVDLVYLDFQKAFDKVPHERLMAKVEAHGMRGNYSRWIRNWLTGRTQRVVIHDQASDSTLVTSGVPQGSV
ncbi:Reverse transcriptase domain [Trinorchestia longiramus]|nr:Reverse transcriptase domain [Trinorchestia longiramus]